jgi:hypothetical protein
MREPSLAETLEVARACWTHFKQGRAWPAKKLFAREHPQWAARVLYPEKNKLPHIQLYDTVIPDWEVLFQLDEVRQLLAPLPGLVREVIARVVANPPYVNHNESRLDVTLADFQRLWGSAEEAQLAVHLLGSQRTPWFGWRNMDPRDAPFSPSLDILAFEKARTLDDLLRMYRSRDGDTAKVTRPQDAHLELLRRVDGHLRRKGAWPEAVPFAVEHRSIGYIPELVDALAPQFIQAPWRGGLNDRIKLTRESLPLVSTPQERDLLARAIPAMARISLHTEEQLSARMIAHELQVPEEQAGPLLHYLEQEPWVSFEPPDFKGHPWSLGVKELIFRFQDVERWEDYERSLQQYREEQQRAAEELVLRPPWLRQAAPGTPLPPSEEGQNVHAKVARKQGRIFVSHAEKDKKLAEGFVDLLEYGMGVRHEAIVYTSRETQAVTPGAYFGEYLRQAINDCELFICLVSTNLYASKFALCELGAAWGARKTIIPVLVPPLGPKDLEAVLEGVHGVELLEQDKLTGLYDLVRERLTISADASRWSLRVRRFLKEAQELLAQRAEEKPEPAGHPVSRRPGDDAAAQVAGYSSRPGDPSVWFQVGERLKHRDSLGGEEELEVEVVEGPRAYMRIIPAGWQGRPSLRGEVRKAPSHLRLSTLGAWSHGDGGMNSLGVLETETQGQKRDGKFRTRTATQWFSTTGEIWGFDNNVIDTDQEGKQVLAYIYLIQRWRQFLGRGIDLLRHLGAGPVLRVEAGVTGLKGIRWAGRLRSERVVALDDTAIHQRQSSEWSDADQHAFLAQAFNKVCEAFGFAPVTEEQFSRLLGQ